TSPRETLDSLLLARRLAEDIRALVAVGLHDRQRLEWVTGLRARAADPVVALERGDGAVGGAASRQLWPMRSRLPSGSLSSISRTSSLQPAVSGVTPNSCAILSRSSTQK